MRIALTGTHCTGKTTLVAALVHAHPDLAGTVEPYYRLLNDGYLFSPSLSLDDFTAQLECSLGQLDESTRNVVFDRCPLDYLGYLACHSQARNFAFDEWLPRIQESVRTLDLLVYVPIENPDRIALSLSTAERASRAAVDKALRGFLDSGMFQELGIERLTVSGAVQDRVRQILQQL